MYFSKMKEKGQKAYRIKSYDDMLLNTISSMFVYEIPGQEKLEYFSPMIDIYRILEGASAICKGMNEEANAGQYTDEYTICHVDFGGDPYPTGIGSIAICTTDNGVVRQFEDWYNNPDVAIFFCNRLGAPDMNIGRFSDMLAELEVSMKTNILFSRMYPIPVVGDGKLQKAVEEAINNILVGKVATVLDQNRLKKYLGSEAENLSIDMVNLTDVDKSQYIQYLAKMRDDIMRWFYSYYGMNSQGSSKLAQQTVDEVNQDNNASMIIPHDMLREADKGCKMVSDKFGIDMKVSFSECWMSRLANFDDEFKTTDEALAETAEPNEALAESVDETPAEEYNDDKDESKKDEEGKADESE